LFENLYTQSLHNPIKNINLNNHTINEPTYIEDIFSQIYLPFMQNGQENPVFHKLKSFYDLMERIFPGPHRDPSKLLQMINFVQSIHSFYHAQWNLYESANEQSIQNYYDLVIKVWINFVKQKNKQFQATLQPILEKFEKYDNYRIDLIKNDNIQALNKVSNVLFNQFQNQWFPDYFQEYRQLIENAIEKNKNKFFQLTEEFHNIVDNYSHSTKYFSNLNFLYDFQQMNYKLSLIPTEPYSSDYNYQLGKITGFSENINFYEMREFEYFFPISVSLSIFL
jgi:hypothetical protein